MEPQRTELPYEDRPSAATGLTPREALEGAKAALAAQGLEMTDFGLHINEQVTRGVLSEDDGIRLILEHHRAKL